jgi:hypothetical protein
MWLYPKTRRGARYQSKAFYRYIYEATYGDKHDAARVVYHYVYEDPLNYTICRFKDVYYWRMANGKSHLSGLSVAN